MRIHATTKNTDILSDTIGRILNQKKITLDMRHLTDAMEKMPFTSYLGYNKITGNWFYSNQDEDMWQSPCDEYAGANFTFVDKTPEMAVARGINYYYFIDI